jgi:tetratricopeptide (TPR) repeat protein
MNAATRPWLAGLLALLAASCASAMHGRPSGPAKPDGSQGWLALLDGKSDVAAASFARALADDPSDARALFGAANLAFEHGDSNVALAHALTLLEAASQGRDALAVTLSSAVLARVSRLLAEVPDRRMAEDRVVALAPQRLPWKAQYLLALTVIDIARKRADEALLAKAVAWAGCAQSLLLVGSWGRLPSLDLDGEGMVPEAKPRALIQTGCQFQLNAVDNRSGVRILRAEIESASGRFDLVLDYGGPARLRVDNGPWREHGVSADVYGPRWSAERMETSAGKHTVEIRVGAYGSTVDLALLAIPAADPVTRRPSKAVSDSAGDTAMLDLAAALVANLSGEVDLLLTQIERLAAHPRFALGLAAAARLGEMDPTRPADIMRDRARALWQQAVASDPGMARVWLDLSKLDLHNDQPREATEKAERARQVSPSSWPAHLAVATALRAQGLEQPADAALATGLTLVEGGLGACDMIDAAFHRAEARDDVRSAARLVDWLGRCDAQDGNARSFAQRRGELDKALSLLRRALPTSAEPLWLRSEIADLLLAQGHLRPALDELAALVQLAPRDTRLRIRLADVQAAMGKPEQARATLAAAVHFFPGRSDVRRAARLAGLALPLDDYRLDGEQVMRDYLASGRSYQAPAVVVLDRAVERVYADGTRLVLTHSITQVLSKDAIAAVGEVQVPEGAEILVLRTRKADGTSREAEEIAGKSTISAPELGVGDFVEAETLEVKEPILAFAPGFVGERFFFQSFEAPLDRSEYLLVAPVAMPLDVDRRADAPLAVTTLPRDGTRVLTFVVHGKAQAFPERSAVPALEWIPSVRVSSSVPPDGWSRFVANRAIGLSRGSPELRKVAAALAKQVGDDRRRLPEAIVAWVREHIEPENDFGAAATATLARHRGNRAWLMLALARSLGVDADGVLARSLLKADADAPATATEQDDFRELLVRFPSLAGDRFVDPQIRRAPFDYLLPGFDGAPAVVVGTQKRVTAVSGVKDSRSVTLRAHLEADGGAKVAVTEQLSGWPSVEWTELLDRAGKDRSKLRQDFEQNWLGHQFPGAQLDKLSVEPGEGGAGTRVSYTFRSARMAGRQEGVLHLRPVFFQAQPGRRFGTEPQRKTTLMLGYDIPLDLDAEIALPSGAKVVDVGQGGDVTAGGARFFEKRRVTDAGNGLSTVSLHRQSRLPIMRVLPGDYQDVAARLRAVDPVEQGEIRIAVPAK